MRKPYSERWKTGRPTKEEELRYRTVCCTHDVTKRKKLNKNSWNKSETVDKTIDSIGGRTDLCHIGIHIFIAYT